MRPLLKPDYDCGSGSMSKPDLSAAPSFVTAHSKMGGLNVVTRGIVTGLLCLVSSMLSAAGATVAGDSLACADRGVETLKPGRCMSLQTNMLYDLAMLPSIAFEYYFGDNVSAAVHWTYGWWSTDRRHRYWRAYGGDIAVRYWFGRRAQEKPLTGHHAGAYYQALIYDFEFGGKGNMAGRPGVNLWERANHALGVEYGYSLPVGRRLNIDFTLGVGYMWGPYYEYKPINDCYVWQATRQRHWWGPTKLEVSLVWLLGRDNHNGKKGGAR